MNPTQDANSGAAPQPVQPQQQYGPAPQQTAPQQPAQFNPMAVDPSDYYANGQKPGITIGVLSIVFFWIPLVAWILGGIALSKGSVNPTLKTLGIIGIIAGTLSFVYYLTL